MTMSRGSFCIHVAGMVVGHPDEKFHRAENIIPETDIGARP
jgi:hypothetical protein